MGKHCIRVSACTEKSWLCTQKLVILEVDFPASDWGGTEQMEHNTVDQTCTCIPKILYRVIQNERENLNSGIVTSCSIQPKKGIILQCQSLHEAKQLVKNWCCFFVVSRTLTFVCRWFVVVFSEYRVHVTDSVSDGDLTNKSVPGDMDRSLHSLPIVSGFCSPLFTHTTLCCCGNIYGHVSFFCLSQHQFSIETFGRISLFLAWWLSLTYYTVL